MVKWLNGWIVEWLNSWEEIGRDKVKKVYKVEKVEEEKRIKELAD